MVRKLRDAKRPPTHEELRLLVHGFGVLASETFCARCAPLDDDVRLVDAAWLVREDLPHDHVLRVAVDVLCGEMDEPELRIALGVRAFDPEPDALHSDLEAEVREARRDLSELNQLLMRGRRFSLDGFVEGLDRLVENRERWLAMLAAISARRAVVDGHPRGPQNYLTPREHGACSKLARTGGDGTRYPQPVEQAIGSARREVWLPVQSLLRAKGWSYEQLVELLLCDAWSVPGGRMAPKLYRKHRASDRERAKLADQLRQLQSKSARS